MLSCHQLKRGGELPILKLSVGNINLSDKLSPDGIDAYLHRSAVEKGGARGRKPRSAIGEIHSFHEDVLAIINVGDKESWVPWT